VALRNPTSQELSAELNKQRLVIRRLLEIQQRAFAGEERARALLVQTAAMKDNQERLMRLIEEYNIRLDRMETQLHAIPRPEPASPRAEPAPPDAPVPRPGESPPPVLEEGRRVKL
jgi:hypothetical protein